MHCLWTNGTRSFGMFYYHWLSRMVGGPTTKHTSEPQYINQNNWSGEEHATKGQYSNRSQNWSIQSSSKHNHLSWAWDSASQFKQVRFARVWRWAMRILCPFFLTIIVFSVSSDFFGSASLFRCSCNWIYNIETRITNKLNWAILWKIQTHHWAELS